MRAAAVGRARRSRRFNEGSSRDGRFAMRAFVRFGHMGARHRRRRLWRAHRLWRTRRRRGVNDGSVARCEWWRKRCVGHTRASRAIGASHSPNAISASTDCPTSRNAPSPFKTIAFLPNVSAPPNCLLPR
ncbi:hypothetical protein X977_4483 [Burkholderia pseudomallei MSHR7504]|nr:hypothetical protein X977_4483 [Burkholderia pseudomallei MSHR7504]